MRIIKEFKEFAIKGNVFDMAIGVIIGTAFGKIVTSLVNDVIMPSLATVVGKVELEDAKVIVKEAVLNEDGSVLRPEVVLNYGNFIQVSIDFILVAFSIFLIVKLFNKLKRKAEDPKEKTVPTPADIQLLSEIRDLLQKQGKTQK